MNGAISQTPSTGTPNQYDGVCAIGKSLNIVDGGAAEGQIFGAGTFIGTGTIGDAAGFIILSVAHVLNFGAPATQSGWNALPLDPEDNAAKTARFRRKAGSVVGDGDAANYTQLPIAGYWAPTPLNADSVVMAVCIGDVAEGDLPDPITCFDADAFDDLESGDPLTIAGWGLDGSTIGTGSYPNDCRYIDDRTIIPIDGARFIVGGTGVGANSYDSGGPAFVDVSGDLQIAGVIQTAGGALAVRQFKNDPLFQIPGYYEFADPGEAVDPSTLRYSEDANIKSDEPNGSFVITSTPLYVQNLFAKGTPTRKMVFVGFDVATETIPVSATLRLVASTGTATVRVRRLRRIVTNDVNWNTYDGVNGWSTTGAEDTDDDVYTDHQFTFDVAGASDTDVEIADNANLLAMILEARQEDGVLRLILEAVDASTQVRFYPVDVADYEVSKRPSLEIGYTSELATTRRMQRSAGRQTRMTSRPIAIAN